MNFTERCRDVSPNALDRALAERGLAQRLADYKEVLRETGDRRAAMMAYCAGNKWLLENARAVGNL